MDLSSIAQLTTSISGVGSQSGSFGSNTAAVARNDSAAAVAKANKRAADRTEQQLESTQVQLSAYGQIKGAVSELQAASKAVSEPRKTATADDARKTIENFVSAYNKANATVARTTRNDRNEPGALATDARARIAGNDLRRSVAENEGLAELRKAGITQNKDGSLALDTKTLDRALQQNPPQTVAAVAGVARQVERTATRELAGSGNVGASVQTLDQRSRRLEAEQASQQALVEASQRTVQQKTANVTQAASGIAAYQRNFLG